MLEELDDLQEYLILPKVDEKCTPSWFGFLISVREDAPFTKQELVEYLEANEIGTRQLFAGNLLRQPMITEHEVQLKIGNSKLLKGSELTEEHYAKLPKTEFIMNNTFWVGVAQNVDKTDMLKTAKTIRTFINTKA